MVKKVIRGGTCHAVYQYVKPNNKYMENYDKNKESSNLKHWDVKKLYRWAMTQKSLVNDFKWVEETSQFNEDFIKIYNEDFLKLIFSIQKNYITFKRIQPFLHKRMEIQKIIILI